MRVNALIVEQLEADGTLTTLQFKPRPEVGDLVVAFADEYEDFHEGPFHFLDERYEREFAEAQARCRKRRLTENRFHRSGEYYHFSTSWRGIPTELNQLSYYALCLPQFGVPTSLHIFDPEAPDTELERWVAKDELYGRFVIYIECVAASGLVTARAANAGLFNFDLYCTFEIASESFSEAHADDRIRRTNEPPTWDAVLPQITRRVFPSQVRHRLTRDIHTILAERFNEEELRTLCFEVNMRYEDLGAEGAVNKARELVMHFDRHRQILELVEAIRRLRPDIAM
jgi:hypothetical protein